MIKTIQKFVRRAGTRVQLAIVKALGIDTFVSNTAARLNAMERHLDSLTTTVVDIPASRRGNTTIIVASEVGGGRVKVIQEQFDSIREFEQFCRSHFPQIYNARRRYVDAPEIYRGDLF